MKTEFRATDIDWKKEVRAVSEQSIAEKWPSFFLPTRLAHVAAEHGLSERSVGSIGAYVRYSATEVLKKAQLLDVLSKDALIELAYNIRRCSPSQRAEALEQASLSHGIPSAKVEELVMAYEQCLAKRPSASDQRRIFSPEERSAPQSKFTRNSRTDSGIMAHAKSEHGDDQPQVPQPSVHQRETSSERGKAGWEVEYNNIRKERHREHWEQFLEKHCSESQRRDGTVAYLPSRLPELELRHYDRLEIQRANVTGVESKPKIQGIVEAACAREGIGFFGGDLASFLRERGQPLILSIDSHLWFSANIVNTLEQIDVSKELFLLLNVQAKRERDPIQDELFAYADRMNNSALGQPVDQLTSRRLYHEKVSEDGIVRWQDTDLRTKRTNAKSAGAKLKELRPHVLPYVVVHNMARLTHPIVVEIGGGPECGVIASRLSNTLFDLFMPPIRCNRQFKGMSAPQQQVLETLAYEVCRDALLRVCRVKACEKYYYRSLSGKKVTPMVSVFLHLVPQENPLTRSRALGECFEPLLRVLAAEPNYAREINVTERLSRVWRPGGLGVRSSQEVRYEVRWRDKKISSISASDFYAALIDHANYRRSWLHDDQLAAIPLITIE